jgi:hypothetical protein
MLNPLSGPPATRRRGKTLLVTWSLSALSASLVVWFADVAFYDRFGMKSSDLPSWSAWSALELTVQVFAWLVVGALWLWWPRRHAVVAGAVIALVVLGMGTRAWAHHEADRARAGTPVWPRAVLPFTFSARAATLIPHGTEALPQGMPSRVLLLRSHPDSVVVYDPTRGDTMRVSREIAVAAGTAGGR